MKLFLYFFVSCFSILLVISRVGYNGLGALIDIPSIVILFLGIFSSLLAGRLNLTKQFVRELKEINPCFFCQPKFWRLVGGKVFKMLKLKSLRYRYGRF